MVNKNTYSLILLGTKVAGTQLVYDPSLALSEQIIAGTSGGLLYTGH